ncbi:MAG: hypothetical protein MUC83_09965 [Pirellula sp.]|nr:hypothetical protein [Pirellula sp.]
MLMALGMAKLPISSVPLVLLWSVNSWLAIGIFFVCLIPVGLIMSAGYWWNVKVVRKRINEWLLATEDTKELPKVM